MKLLALKAIRKIASRTHCKIYVRSSWDNMDHDKWFKLAVDLCRYKDVVLKTSYYLESQES